MPEFNLRVECIADRIRWERGIPTNVPAQTMQPITKRKLIDVLAEARKQTQENRMAQTRPSLRGKLTRTLPNF
jgi:hypothetical protein